MLLALLAFPHSSTSMRFSSLVQVSPVAIISYQGMNKNANDSSGNKLTRGRGWSVDTVYAQYSLLAWLFSHCG